MCACIAAAQSRTQKHIIQNEREIQLCTAHLLIESSPLPVRGPSARRPGPGCRRRLLLCQRLPLGLQRPRALLRFCQLALPAAQQDMSYFWQWQPSWSSQQLRNSMPGAPSSASAR